MALKRRCVAALAAFVLGSVATLPAVAQPAAEQPLTKVRSWTLSGDDLRDGKETLPRYRLQLDMAVVSGTRWAPEVILGAVKRAASILAQCDLQVRAVHLHEFSGPPRFRYFHTPDSREFARRAGLRKPALFFVEDTRQRPAFDAEAIGRANARTRPEMADTVWMTAAIRDLPVAIAHELAHVLADSGEHSDAPDNLMREDTAPGNTQLAAEQCSRIIAVGRAHGLIEPAIVPGPRR